MLSKYPRQQRALNKQQAFPPAKFNAAGKHRSNKMANFLPHQLYLTDHNVYSPQSSGEDAILIYKNVLNSQKSASQDKVRSLIIRKGNVLIETNTATWKNAHNRYKQKVLNQ